MKIFIANSPAEAHIAHQQLVSQGIQSEVRGESLYGLRGEVPFDESTLPYVWLIDTRRAPEAKRTIENWQINLSNAGEGLMWLCQACEEENEAQFDICWNCMQPNISEVKS
ncbi:DUF2007 domain-containing protein [Vibrio hippocampi]|uniref:RanBP2-type domain-containing protein n=1 Tax=Vibrio hippocampi TaxID=654686 RepID=A0ABM8ZGS0_9VIBR|nr:DUF2007 domain-containing protein [Vibrio hippocampi]CAH0525584.1 hypothetical protein VHP8226_01111 [Vibrio hippocampi]